MGRDKRRGDGRQEGRRRGADDPLAEAKRLQRAERKRAQAAAEASAREEDESSMWELKYCFQDPVGVISITEDWSGEGNGIAGLQWLGGVVLSRYMDSRQVFPEEYFVGRRIIEVGAGCGLTSIYAAMRGAHVTITDMDIDKCIHNIESNLGPRGLTSMARIQRLKWASAEDLAACEPPYDVVLAGDCLYEEACIVPLLKTMWTLAGLKTEVFLCGVVGHEILERFLSQVDAYFFRQTVDTSLVDTLAGAQGAGRSGGPNSASRGCDEADVVSSRPPHDVAVDPRDGDALDPAGAPGGLGRSGGAQRPGQRALLRLQKKLVVATDTGAGLEELLERRKAGEGGGGIGGGATVDPAVATFLA